MKRSLFLILCPILLAACFGHKAQKHPERYLNLEAFPSDLKKDGHILLVLKQETSALVSNIQNKRVKKLMDKYYDKPYELVSSADVKSNPKYADKNVYRYLIMQATHDAVTSIERNRQGAEVNSMTFVHRDVFIMDRLTEKGLPGAGLNGDSYEADMMIVAPYLGKMK